MFKGCTKGHSTIATSTPSIQQKHIEEEKEDIVSSPTMVPTKFPINPRYNKFGGTDSTPPTTGS
jgi:hypothetical protein